MPSNPEEIASEAFARAFGGNPTALGKAPGRVELLGNHTDYNGGLVLASAIDRSTVVVGRVREGGSLAKVYSSNLAQYDTFAIDLMVPGQPSDSWGRYVEGVTWAIQKNYGPLPSGFEAALAGDVPIGAGLSSSASLQAAFAMFLIGEGLTDPSPGESLDQVSRLELAHTLRRSENEYVGVASGLLDQFSSLFGKAGHAFVLDCRSLDHEILPLGNPSPAIVVCDSKTSRRLADGQYNRRRAECERVVDHFQKRKPDRSITQLRDITLDELRDEWSTLDPVGRLRARHVLTENDRVLAGADALRTGNLIRFGALMSTSHASSRDDFENSSPALDALFEAAEESPGFLGGKLSGAGWAGCTVNLVKTEDAEAFADSLKSGYDRRTGLVPDVHICHAAEGASCQRLSG
jgi:galactokinase